MTNDALMIVAGLVLLTLGGEGLVRGAVALAHRLGVSTLIISLTVVAFGTSAPEMVVGVQAALSGSPDVAIGNVVGSNIANQLLILGMTAAIAPVFCDERTVRRDGVAVVVASLVVLAMAATGGFGTWQGIVLLALLVGYFLHRYRQDRRDTKALEAHAEEVSGQQGKALGLPVTVAITLGSLAVLVLGADLLVGGAVGLARAAGVSEAVIGLTLVAFGTSLPELATCVMAAIRRHSEVALGNILGSNLFNLLGILGTVGLVAHVPVAPRMLHFDLWVMLGVAIVLIPMMLIGRRINRVEGVLLSAAYCAYGAWLFLGPAG